MVLGDVHLATGIVCCVLCAVWVLRAQTVRLEVSLLSAVELGVRAWSSMLGAPSSPFAVRIPQRTELGTVGSRVQAHLERKQAGLVISEKVEQRGGEEAARAHFSSSSLASHPPNVLR